MSAFLVTGASQSLTLDGSNQNLVFDPQNAVNPITGGQGLTALRITHNGTTTSTGVTLTTTLTTKTYDYLNLSPTGGSGTGAAFNVSVGYNLATPGAEYTITIADPGVDYAVDDTLTIPGGQVGNAGNPITITVTEVGDAGEIVDFVFTGTALWPQNTSVSQFIVLPNNTDIVQISGISNTGGVYVTLTGADGDAIITPVQITG